MPASIDHPFEETHTPAASVNNLFGLSHLDVSCSSTHTPLSFVSKSRVPLVKISRCAIKV